MNSEREMNLALFIDFDNVALGARDARQRFEVKLLMHRILEKGKVIVKRAYADWHYYKEHMIALHEAAIELIEVPMPRISGKNSADIKMVVDAMDLCYSKDHIDAFVLVTGDSDFSPLVSKLRENDKRVIGVGMKNSSSKLLIGNCDEFIFYDDIYHQARGRVSRPVVGVSGEKGELFDFLVETVQSLLQESRGVLYGSLIKDTMTRKKPDFSERVYGYSTFGDLLEEARNLGLLMVERDAKAGGTWVVQGLGKGSSGKVPEQETAPVPSRSSRRRRRSSDRSGRRPQPDPLGVGAQSPETSEGEPAVATGDAGREEKPAEAMAHQVNTASDSPRDTETSTTGTSASKKSSTKKSGTRKGTTRKKVATKTTSTSKPVTKKAATQKTVAKKTTKKAAAKKSPVRKKTTS